MAISSATSGVSNGASAAIYAKPKSTSNDNIASEFMPDQTQDSDKSDGLQAVHSFVAGALGLDDPKAEKPADEENNSHYTAGKWLAAAGTIGTILSVLA